MQQMHVTGQVDFLDDLSLKILLLKDRPFLRKWKILPESLVLIVFRAAKCRAHFWMVETNLQPKEYVTFG